MFMISSLILRYMDGKGVFPFERNRGCLTKIAGKTNVDDMIPSYLVINIVFFK